MTYVVLARKWRPQRFEELTGQEHVARTLQNAITANRIPHAVLFTGPRGVGKTSSARILSMALNCENGPTPAPCGTCQACEEVKSGRSVDILEIDGASNRGINEIRELRDSVQYAPSRDRYKVYIIDEVHMLTTEAFNALLKTLEEPPPHVIFIFATTEPQKLPVTILSRVQRFDFREIGLADIIGRLEHILSHEGIEAEPDALRMIARQAAGGMRDALSLMDQVISSSAGNISAEQTADLLGATDRRLLFALSEAVFAHDTALALQTLQRALQRGADTSWLAGEFASHMRDLAVLAVAGPHADLTILSEDERLTAQKQLTDTDGATLEVLLDLMLSAAEEIAASSMGTLRFELALIRMCQVPSRTRIDHLISLLEAHAGIATPLADAPVTAAPTAPSPAPPVNADHATSTGDSSPHAHAPSTTQDTAPRGAERSDATRPDTTETAVEPEDPEPSAAQPAPTPTPTPEEPASPAAPALAEPPAAVDSAPDEPAPASPVNSEPALAETSAATDSAPEPSAPSTATQPADGTLRAPTLDTWRQAVTRLDGPLRFARRMLAMSHCIAEDGVFRIAAPETYVKEREDLQAAFDEISTDLFGRPWTLELVEDTSFSDADRARAWVIRTKEQEEEEAMREQIQARIAKTPLIQSVQRRWPQYRLNRDQITFTRLDEASMHEQEDDL